MPLNDIYIIGSSGHAKVVTELIEEINEYNIAGYIDDFKKKANHF